MKRTPKPPVETTKPCASVVKPEPSAPWPTQEKVKNLAKWLDVDYCHLEAMVKSRERLLLESNDYTRKQIIQEAERVIEEFEITGALAGLKRGRAQKLWNECNPESWSDENCNAFRGEVAKMIAILMGSFPTSKIPEPGIFVPVLLDDVMALNPSLVEMETTCRELRKTKKFMPSVSEVIEELEKQKKLWERRSDVAFFLEENYDDLRIRVAEAKAEEERRIKAEEERRAKAEEAAKAAEEAKVKAIAERLWAKSQPIVVGDRVRNCNAGAGTVTAIEQYTPEIVKCRVRFDVIFKGKNEPEVGAQYLERLIAGDEGFEHPAVPMIEHCKDVPMTPIASPTVPLDANGDKVGVRCAVGD